MQENEKNIIYHTISAEYPIATETTPVSITEH